MHVGATLRWPLRIAQLRALKNVRRRPTLPQPLGCSTIGAERLNFRVRDGTGCFPFAMAAVTLAVTSPRGSSRGLVTKHCCHSSVVCTHPPAGTRVACGGGGDL